MKNVLFTLMFVLGLGVLGVAQANGTPTQQVPCYADKKYKVAEDCPHCCEVNCFRICFDEDGHLKLRFEGTLVKEKIRTKSYFVSYDIDGDGKADVTINAKFSECDDDHCGRVKGTIVSVCPQEEGAVKKEKNKCTFVGYTTDHDNGNHEDECCISLKDLAGRRDRD